MAQEIVSTPQLSSQYSKSKATPVPRSQHEPYTKGAMCYEKSTARLQLSFQCNIVTSSSSLHLYTSLPRAVRATSKICFNRLKVVGSRAASGFPWYCSCTCSVTRFSRTPSASFADFPSSWSTVVVDRNEAALFDFLLPGRLDREPAMWLVDRNERLSKDQHRQRIIVSVVEQLFKSRDRQRRKHGRSGRN